MRPSRGTSAPAGENERAESYSRLHRKLASLPASRSVTNRKTCRSYLWRGTTAIDLGKDLLEVVKLSSSDKEEFATGFQKPSTAARVGGSTLP